MFANHCYYNENKIIQFTTRFTAALESVEYLFTIIFNMKTVSKTNT